MSNNGDVEYNGTSYYFTFEQSRTVADIKVNSKVALGFTSDGGIFSMPFTLQLKATLN